MSGTCKHGRDQPHYTLPQNAYQCDGKAPTFSPAAVESAQELLDAIILNLLPPEHHLIIDAGALLQAALDAENPKEEIK